MPRNKADELLALDFSKDVKTYVFTAASEVELLLKLCYCSHCSIAKLQTVWLGESNVQIRSRWQEADGNESGHPGPGTARDAFQLAPWKRETCLFLTLANFLLAEKNNKAHARVSTSIAQAICSST